MARPYLLVRELTAAGEREATAHWRPSGAELGDGSGPRPAEVPGALLLEALVQCGGRLLHLTDSEPGSHWLLGSVRSAELGRTPWDVELILTCEVGRRSARGATLVGRATRDGSLAARAEFTLLRLRG